MRKEITSKILNVQRRGSSKTLSEKLMLKQMAKIVNPSMRSLNGSPPNTADRLPPPGVYKYKSKKKESKDD